MNWEENLSEYGKNLLKFIQEYGGTVDAHTHLDRCYTLDPNYWRDAGIDPFEAATLPLSVKQDLIGELHKSPAYAKENLECRMTLALEKAIIFKTKKIITFVDVTPDIGLTAVEAALSVKEKFKDKIELQIGVHPIFGFKNPKENPDRWEIFAEAAEKEKIEIIGGLPEKDDEQGKIGFDEHVQRIINLGIKLNKEVHIHIDQGNDPREKGTETVLEAVRWLGSPKIKNSGTPTIWLIHAISPSCYEENRFKEILGKIKKFNLGVIICPRAAISMNQLRPLSAPIHNSIARILEMVRFEIHLRFGTDNISDIFIPAGEGSILEEMEMVSNICRYYEPKFWAKLGCDERLNNMDKELGARVLYQSKKVFEQIKL